jgi:hypothetical protein
LAEASPFISQADMAPACWLCHRMSAWEMNGDASANRYDFGFDQSLSILAIRDLAANGQMGILAQGANGDLATFMFNAGQVPTVTHIGHLSTDWILQ